MSPIDLPATPLLHAEGDPAPASMSIAACDDAFRQAFEHAGVGMIVVDLNGVLVHFNQAVCELLGYEREQLTGRSFDFLKHPDEAALESDQFHKLKAGELSRIHSERRYLHRNGQELWLQVNAALVRNAEGQPSYLVAHMHSIDDRRKAEIDLRSLNSQLARLASFDGLTGLPNRRTLLTGFEQMWISSRDAREPLSCVILDIDHFKLVNDCHGHAAGDEVLRHVGTVLQHAVRPTDLCGRWGGEEFLLVCNNTRADEAHQLAEQIRHLIALQPVTWRDLSIPITVSLGVAQRTIVCHEPHELIALADEQLYTAKRLGRNCTCMGADTVGDDVDEDSRQTAVFRPTNK
jgi:diguanylate cyclase (GGDEF)-like protein/PAS domain S-box-containing protein